VKRLPPPTDLAVYLRPDSESGAGGYNTRKGKKPASLHAGFQLPAPAPTAGSDKGITMKSKRSRYSPWSDEAAYWVHVRNYSMAPKYRPSDDILATLRQPLTPGHGVVVKRKNGTMQILSLVRSTHWQLVCEQMNPRRQITIPRKDVLTAHCVVATIRSELNSETAA